MIRTLIFLLLILLALNSSAQTYSSLTTDEEIENFINWYVSDSSIPRSKKYFDKNILPIKRGYFTTSNSKSIGSIYFLNSKFLDSIFTASDKNFFIQQIDSIKTEEWRISKLHFKKKIRKQETASLISIPIFSLNRAYAIIQLSRSCSQTYSCVGVYLYKATNSGWKLYKTLKSYFIPTSHNNALPQRGLTVIFSALFPYSSSVSGWPKINKDFIAIPGFNSLIYINNRRTQQRISTLRQRWTLCTMPEFYSADTATINIITFLNFSPLQ